MTPAEDNEHDLQKTQELFDFLKGNVPEGCTIDPGHMPKLTSDQAWTVIWWLTNQYWQVTDHIERCNVCGDLYNTENSGRTLDYGEAPYNFCDDCMNTEQFATKAAADPGANTEADRRGV